MTRTIPPDPSLLPVAEVLDEVRAALATTGRVSVVAPPWAGKTTLVPPALLDEPWLGNGRIVMLEPRRLAARAAARRIAGLLGGSPGGGEVGGLVGYQTRDERRIGRQTRIEVLTEGILTRRLQHDPELPGTGVVVFDEVHERNLPTDLGLALAVDTAGTIRPDLRLVAMSATPDVDGLRRVLGEDTPVVESRGRAFEVDVRWGRRPPARPGRGARAPRVEDRVADTVLRALREERGDVLVFLPGIGEINRIRQRLEQALDGEAVDLHRLAGAVPLAEQDAALAPSPPGRRRVVLATDIAETSLTVDGIRVVVDSGLARAPRFDVRTGLTRLATVTTSRSSADQRAGRAGRVEPGVAYRLWSKVEHGARAKHRVAEIEEVDLAGLALEVAAWGTPVDDLAFVTPPPAGALAAARRLLTDLSALDGDGRLTDLGRAMLALPVHPRLARMLVASPTMLSCIVASLVDEQDIMSGRPDERPVDLALRVAVVTGRDHHDRADRGRVHRLRDRAVDLARRLGISPNRDTVDPDGAGAVLLHAFPDRLAVGRGRGQFQLRTGGRAALPPTDPLADEEFIVAAEVTGKRDRARIRLAAALDADEVAAQLAAEVDERITLIWDSERDDLVERVERRLGGMSLGEAVVRRARSGDDTLAALLDRVRATGLAALGWSQASTSLRSRVAFLHRHRGAPWPDWSVAALSASLEDWLGPYLPGATGRADLEGIDLTMVLRSQLPWPEGADLDTVAPPALTLPTGRSVPIDYGDDGPSARVRVQDLFGTTVHPTAGGLPIVLHLLSPADRPIQVTADLPGFWAGSWAQVRKDLAGRYPKHHWPDDPGTAEPRRLR
ncbi:MAG: ATP-dependent helicase HrpB [Acidimicrobiales bacterium]